MRLLTAASSATRSRCAIVAAVAALALAAMASPASAATTIGSDLTASDGTTGCGVACTGVGTALPGRTIASPITGVVVRWRVGDGVGQITFRVARPAADTYPGDDTHIGGRSQRAGDDHDAAVGRRRRAAGDLDVPDARPDRRRRSPRGGPDPDLAGRLPRQGGREVAIFDSAPG